MASKILCYCSKCTGNKSWTNDTVLKHLRNDCNFFWDNYNQEQSPIAQTTLLTMRNTINRNVDMLMQSQSLLQHEKEKVQGKKKLID